MKPKNAEQDSSKEVNKKLLMLRGRDPQVVAAYHKRRFGDAYKLATAYDACRPGGDTAARLYMERSARFVASPPPAAWDPTYVLTEK